MLGAFASTKFRDIAKIPVYTNERFYTGYHNEYEQGTTYQGILLYTSTHRIYV